MMKNYKMCAITTIGILFVFFSIFFYSGLIYEVSNELYLAWNYNNNIQINNTNDTTERHFTNTESNEFVNNRSNGTLTMAAIKKNVTVLCSEDEYICFYSNNLSMPNVLIDLGNDTYGLKLPKKSTNEVWRYR